MEESCLFCLETIQENLTANPTGCFCKIEAHQACLHAWYIQKQCIECPICHTVSILTPVEDQERFQLNQKIVCACCILFFWAISIRILDSLVAE